MKYPFLLLFLIFSFIVEAKTDSKDSNSKVYESTSDLTFSNPKISNLGFYNNFDFLIKNVNSDTQNSSNYKNPSTLFRLSILLLRPFTLLGIGFGMKLLILCRVYSSLQNVCRLS